MGNTKGSKRTVRPNLKKNTKEKGSNLRYRLTEDEQRILMEYRDGKASVIAECEAKGIPLKDVQHYWYKSKHYSMFVKNKGKNYSDIRKELVDELKAYAPKYKEYKYDKCDDPHLIVIDPADVHIGKLCTIPGESEYNQKIAVDLVNKAVTGILQKAQGFEIEQFLFVAGNDILHTDGHSKTTAGTPQDTDGMWYDNFKVAKQLYIDVLERLTKIAPVHFMFNPSNHDHMSGYFLADVISSWFHNNKNITFDCSINHRKYYKYGKNLIGTTHANGAKPAQLPLLMATEVPVLWAETEFRYIYGHHVHHKMGKDFQTVSFESMRSVSGSDVYHHIQGYKSIQAMEGFAHSKNSGQVARITHYV